MSEEVISVNITNSTTNSTLSWANEWLSYLALGMFSMVLLVPTLGIVGLMVWEYFSDEAERKAERYKEIEQVMRERYSGKPFEPLDDEDIEDIDERTPLNPSLHKRRPKTLRAEDFDNI